MVNGMGEVDCASEEAAVSVVGTLFLETSVAVFSWHGCESAKCPCTGCCVGSVTAAEFMPMPNLSSTNNTNNHEMRSMGRIIGELDVLCIDRVQIACMGPSSEVLGTVHGTRCVHCMSCVNCVGCVLAWVLCVCLCSFVGRTGRVLVG